MTINPTTWNFINWQNSASVGDLCLDMSAHTALAVQNDLMATDG
jgi:hypothetical protein